MLFSPFLLKANLSFYEGVIDEKIKSQVLMHTGKLALHTHLLKKTNYPNPTKGI